MKPIQFDKSALHLVQTKSQKSGTTAVEPKKEAPVEAALGFKSLLSVIQKALPAESDKAHLDALKGQVEKHQYKPNLDEVAKSMLAEWI